MFFNRNAVVADFMRDVRNGRNRVAVGNYLRAMTQGSSFLATAGLWDGIPLGFWLAALRVRRDVPRRGWFFLDKYFGGRKVKFVKWEYRSCFIRSPRK